jgi:hypothetical protein
MTAPDNVVPLRPRRDRKAGTLHVRWQPECGWVIEHESSSGGSWGGREEFGPDGRYHAIRRAAALIEGYAPCNLAVADLDPEGELL